MLVLVCLTAPTGPVAEAVQHGQLKYPAIIQSHGGRVRAIESGEIKIDVAFIGAPVCNAEGAMTGAIGRAACGPLSYPQVDAEFSQKVVGLVEEIIESPLPRMEILAEQVDYIVRVDSIGDPSGIESGTTKFSANETVLKIADLAADTIELSGLLKDGFSFQTGAGGASLACAANIGQRMKAKGAVGSFISGGITGAHVDLVKQGLFKKIHDVQCFDRVAVSSYAQDPWHQAMSAAEYASPLNPNSISQKLDVMFLGAAEIDTDFNVNVIRSGDGRIIGGPGGHQDTAEGAKLTIATTQLTAGGYAKIVDQVSVITTQGKFIDVLVTDIGIAVNPRHKSLAEDLRAARLPVVPIETLARMSANKATKSPSENRGEIVAIVENRHGGVLDVVRSEKK